MSRSLRAALIATALVGALLGAPATAQSPAPAVPPAAAALTIDCDAFMATPSATAAVDAPAGRAVIEPMPGAAGSQVLTIAADTAGTAVISASYDRPWEGGEKGAWTLDLTINVQ